MGFRPWAACFDPLGNLEVNIAFDGTDLRAGFESSGPPVRQGAVPGHDGEPAIPQFANRKPHINADHLPHPAPQPIR